MKLAIEICGNTIFIHFHLFLLFVDTLETILGKVKVKIPFSGGLFIRPQRPIEMILSPMPQGLGIENLYRWIQKVVAELK